MNSPGSLHTGDKGEGHGRSQDDGPQLSGEDRTAPDPPPQLDPMIYRRLNTAFDHEQEDASEHLQRLNELGALIRLWRLRRGAARQALADQLGMGVTQLTCLENALAQPSDVSPGQLLGVRALATEDRADWLAAAVDSYLADFDS